MNLNQRKVLVLGASGFVGSHLVPELVKQGHGVRVAGRQPDALRARNWTETEVHYVDVLDAETLPAVFNGIDAVYYLIHGMTEGKGFEDRERIGAINVAEAAVKAGVSQIIYLGALRPEGTDSEHLQSRSATGDYLRQSGLPVTELRAPIVIGPGSAAFEVMRDLVYNLPLMITPKWVRSQMAPIALSNLIHYLVGVLDRPEALDRCFDVAGPETLSYETQMRRFAKIVKRPLWIVPVPLLTPELSSRWLRFITSVPTGIARALVGGLKHDLHGDAKEIQAILPQQLIGFDEAVQLALSAEREDVAAGNPGLKSVLLRRWRPQLSYYAKVDGARLRVPVSASRIWDQLRQIGGKPRYFALDVLWRVREAIDAMVGGNGMRYYRRDPKSLRDGDKVDSWTVTEVVPERKLTLLFGMKAPGMGGLTFELDPQGERACEIKLTCWWFPLGAWGLMYWWAMLPAHKLLFSRMVENIGQRATMIGSAS